ncbi:MAG TPA: YciI family protein [Bacteroidia bacterium]|nr:YciI family protein [Bacteroidia bacterium]
MNEFVLIFRNAPAPEGKMSPEQMQAVMKQWQDWMGGIAAQNKLANPGNRLGGEGKILKPNNVITDGPYVEVKEMLSGYIIVKAESIKEASEMAKGCPILKMGGSVEVRDVIPMTM